MPRDQVRHTDPQCRGHVLADPPPLLTTQNMLTPWYYSLATAEMYVLTANLVRRVRMRLAEGTTVDCVLPAKDHTVVIPRNTSGIKATVLGINTV